MEWLIAAAYGAGFDFHTAPGRLPKDVVPVRYELSLAVDDGPRFSGRETVELTFARPTDRIVLHAYLLRVDEVTLDGAPVARVETDDDAQLVTITLSAPLPAGTHHLSLAFRGRLNDEPSGIYPLAYTDADGRLTRLVTTQLEATDARRVFPCWDEPAFRAVFAVTATVPAAWTAVGNMPVVARTEAAGRATVQFAPSPSMPTYLVELTAGDLAAIHGRAGAVDLAVWAPRGREEEGRVALSDAAEMLADYDAWFGTPYPLPKLDLIALPGGWDGAMENWGAITFADQYLLLGEATTTADREGVYDILAHEVAHQWFGNLVTMGWWDDVWLNESFASWMDARQTDLRHPDWRFFAALDGLKEEALWADARAAARPIHAPVTDEREALGGFDPLITYAKGQAVLRMLETYIGPETFRAGVQRYIADRAYGNATADDLWAALGPDVRQIAEGWTDAPGFPLISARATCRDEKRTLRLSQERFTLSESGAGQWQVPLAIRVGDGPVRSVLLAAEQDVEAGGCDDPVSLNADGIGYYRVAFDDDTLRANTAALATLPDLDRIRLLDDVWALVAIGRRPLDEYLALADALPLDASERAWDQVLSALRTLERATRGTDAHPAAIARASELLRPVAARLGPTSDPARESPARIALRRGVYGAVGRWGDDQVLTEARARYAGWRADRTSLGPDDRGWVLPVVAAHADEATFDALRAAARASSVAERREILGALAGVEDPALAARVARLILSREVPPELDAARVYLALTLAEAHERLGWSLLTGHTARLTGGFGSDAPLYVSLYTAGLFGDEVSAEEFAAWLEGYLPPGLASYRAGAVEAARFRQAVLQRLRAGLR